MENEMYYGDAEDMMNQWLKWIKQNKF